MRLRPSVWSSATRISFLAAAAVWFTALTVVVIRDEIYVDFADGIAHFSLTNYALQDTALFFNSWARPAHVLFGVLPAQLGYVPYVAVHVLLTIATLYLSVELGRLWKVPVLWLIPWWITLNPAVAFVTLAGLTEALFLFIVMLGFLGLERQRWKATAILLGASLYARPEALLFVALGLLWMAAKAPRRQMWKIAMCVLAVPVGMNLVEWWLGYGDKSMAFSAFSFGSMLNIYGSGDWGHFYVTRVKWASTSMLFGVVAATVVLIFRSIQDRIRLIHVALVYAWGVIVVHAFLWRYGLMGSLGLTRIMAIVLPALALVLHGAAGSRRWLHMVLVILFMAHAAQLVHHGALRFERSPQQVLAENVADWIRRQPSNSRWSAQWRMPLVLAGLPFEDTERIGRLWSLPPLQPSSGLAPGDLLLWDNVTGFREGGIDQAIVDRDPKLALVHVFHHQSLEVRAYRVLVPNYSMFQLDSVAPWVSGIGVWERVGSSSLRLRAPKKIGRILGLQTSVLARQLSWQGDSTGTVILRYIDGSEVVLGATGSFRVEPLSMSAVVLWRAENGAAVHGFDAVTEVQR